MKVFTHVGNSSAFLTRGCSYLKVRKWLSSFPKTSLVFIRNWKVFPHVPVTLSERWTSLLVKRLLMINFLVPPSNKYWMWFNVKHVICVQITSSHLNDDFAEKCGLTLDGLKYLFSKNKNLFGYKLKNPKKFKGTKHTINYIHNHGNPTISRTLMKIKHHAPKNKK